MPVQNILSADSDAGVLTQDPVAPFSLDHFSERFTGELRSDHAGETGAVWMYRGVLRVARDPQVQAMAREHLQAEQSHLAFFETWLPRSQHSKLIGLWKISGYLLGFVSASLGAKALYTTIDAVEHFVVIHYQNQLDYLDEQGNAVERTLRSRLEDFQSDEAHHQQDAKCRIEQASIFARLWQGFIGWGSVWAAKAASRW